jgi:hypothetical protein
MVQGRHTILMKIYNTNGFMLPKALNSQHKQALAQVYFKVAILFVIFEKQGLK